jgi:hypothetical protein
MKGYVWQDEEGRWYVERCPKCLLENYAMAVAAGVCAWCGWEAGKDGLPG